MRAIGPVRRVMFKRRSATHGVAAPGPWVETHGYLRVSLRDKDPPKELKKLPKRHGCVNG